MTPALLTALHGNALVIGERGLLILGASGAGKSALTLALIGATKAEGRFARLVSDDRVTLEVKAGRLIARGHPAVAGFIEARGAGILPLETLNAAKLDAVIAIEEAPERMPAPDDVRFSLGEVALPCLRLKRDADLAEKTHLVREWLTLHYP